MESLVQLFDEAAGEPLPLPPELTALYGALRMPARTDRAHVFANFVASLDGIVAIDPPRGTGAEISGGDVHDRAVMGMLRAVADAVVIGAGNLRAEGSFRAQSVVLGSDLEPRTLSGLWVLRWDRKLPRLDLNDVRLTEGSDVFAGQGTTLENEQLRIDLSEGEKRLRLLGSLDPFRLDATDIR